MIRINADCDRRSITYNLQTVSVVWIYHALASQFFVLISLNNGSV